MEEKILYYNIVPSQYQRSIFVEVDPFCNGATVINTGTTAMTVNQIPLNAGLPGTNNGESYSFGGNKGEIYRGRLDISFTGGVGNCVVIQKIYIPSLIQNNDTL